MNNSSDAQDSPTPGSNGASNHSPSGNGSPSETTHAGADSNALLLEAEKKAEEFRNSYLYLRAEFDNYKKHVARERSELLKYGIERFMVDLLAVMDNFDRARSLQVTSENVASFVKGIEMTASELRSLLAKHGVTEVASEGAVFDPNLHEALGSEVRSDLAEGHVSRVLKKPYRLHEKLIRPGQVLVAKPPAEG